MVYTEVKERNNKRYFYRVVSLRNARRISKKRVYLGVDLSKNSLILKEKEADKKLSSSDEIKNKLREKMISKIGQILIKNRIKKAGIFGSYARGEAKKTSDIDLIIEPRKDMGLSFIRLQIELQDKLKRKVDLLTYKSVNPLLREKILKEEIRII